LKATVVSVALDLVVAAAKTSTKVGSTVSEWVLQYLTILFPMEATRPALVLVLFYSMRENSNFWSAEVSKSRRGFVNALVGLVDAML